MVGIEDFYLPLTQRTFIKTLPDKADSEKELTNAQLAGKLLLGIRDPTKFEVDSLLRETGKREYIISEYPVEDGTSRTDGVIKKPRILDIEFVMSDTTVNDFSPLSGIIESKNGRAAELVNQLEDEADRSSYVMVATGKQIYPKMQISSITTTRDPGTGHAIMVSMSLKELRVSKSDDFEEETSNVDDSVKHTVGRGSILGAVALIPLLVA